MGMIERSFAGETREARARFRADDNAQGMILHCRDA